jgi:hypothetical protein
MQAFIVNPQGVTLRVAPNTGGGIIRQVVQGEVVFLDNLIFAQSQNFNALSMDEVRTAFVNKIVRGDVWGRLSEPVEYRGSPVSGYVALKVGATFYGYFLPEASQPPAGGDYNRGLMDGQKLAYNKMMVLAEVEKGRVA